MRIRHLVSALFAATAIACTGAPAIDISANGTNEGNGGISVSTTTDSVITGPGSYTITAFGVATVENNNRVTVTGTTGAEGKLIVSSGIYANNTGAVTTFGSGSLLDNSDTVINSGAMSFDAGSRYTGNGALINLNDMTIHTGTGNVSHLIDNISMMNGSITLVGSTQGLGGKLDFTGGLAHTRVILATDDGGLFNDNVNVGLSDLEITTTTSFRKNVTAANIAIQGGTTSFLGSAAAASSGTVSIASGSKAAFGSTATLTAAGDITIDGGSALHFIASPSGGTPIVSTGGDINLGPTGAIDVTFSGSRADIIGKQLMEAVTGTITNYDILQNRFYILSHRTTGTGEAVYVSGHRTVNDIMTSLMGEETYMSKNKLNGGLYTDAVFDTHWGVTNADLNNYIQNLFGPGMDNRTRIAALGQLYGEYGAYSSSPLVISGGTFIRELGKRTRVFSTEEFCYINEYDEYVYSGGIKRPGRLWVSGLGNWTTQSDRDNIHGYDYSSAGVAVGYDYHSDRFSIGFAGGYTYGTLKVSDLDTKYRTDAMHVGLYGDYVLDSGIYFKGQAAFGRGWNEYGVTMAMGGSKDADYINSSYSASLEIGYNADLGGVTITPAVGMDYTYLLQDSWTESVTRHGNTPLLANTFDELQRNILDIPFSLRLGTSITRGTTVFTPGLRAAWVYRANDRTPDIMTGYAGSNRYVRMYGADSGAGRLSLGGGFSARFGERIDISAQYTFDYATNYRNHTLAGSLGLVF